MNHRRAFWIAGQIKFLPKGGEKKTFSALNGCRSNHSVLEEDVGEQEMHTMSHSILGGLTIDISNFSPP